MQEPEQKDQETIKYSDEEVAYLSKITKRLQDAHDQREQNWVEFNDMTYSEYWESNKKAAMSFIPPKKNESDVRVVTGTTEEKTITLLNALLNQNLEADVVAYDKENLPLVELGENMEDMVKKSRQIEEYEEKRPLIYQELLDQGSVFVEEAYVEEWETKKTLKNKEYSGKIEADMWTERMEKIKNYCSSNLIPGINVYLGNMREFFMEKQPFVFTREQKTWEELKAIYGEWERWEFVSKASKKKLLASVDIEKDYNDWTLVELQEGMCEIIKYQDKWANEMMIIINGVMMLPVGFPLSALCGISEYTISKTVVQPIGPYFAYGKSVPAKTKVDQQYFDEMLKMVLLKNRQSWKPPVANNTGRILPDTLFDAGKIWQDLDATKITRLIESEGVTASEMAAVQFMKSIIDEKSLSPIFEGAEGNKKTAREAVILKQQSQMKIGLPILGVVNLEKKMTMKRILNMIHNQTDKSMTIESTFDDGSRGYKIIDFINDLAPLSEQVEAEEELLSRKFGRKTRKTYINRKIFNQIVQTWHVEVVPTEKETDELKKVLFGETIRDGVELFGPQAFNQEYVKTRWASVNGENAEKMFVQSPQIQPSAVPGIPGVSPTGQIPAQVQQALKPRINDLINA